MSENRLANETSAYLRSAAHQPVQWYAWSAEAFERAKREDKPILLDIGAVWCHWCHVLDHESYDDPAVAAIINEHFIAIKVDRDERPDLDARYQQAVSAISGQGGWPLTGFLTPDGKVFFGGTYFPPVDAFGRPSFKRVLLSAAQYYRESRDEATDAAAHLHRQLAARETPGGTGRLDESLLAAGIDSIRQAFDPTNGGFGDAPKFPNPSTIELLLRRYARTHEDALLEMVLRTLVHTARGGVYDQIGGGFHRYSTDARWIVPHFEKMLYDNAGLLANYVHAWQLTRDPLYRETAEGILAWSGEVLSDRQRGGYFASQDADVGLDDDGDYFTWTLDELKGAVNEDEARVLALYFEVATRGEMHHDPKKNVLFIDQAPEAIAKSIGLSSDRVRDLIASGKRTLKIARDQRPMPAVDHTIFASWNGMMITAALEAAMAFDREDVRLFALKSLHRVLSEMWSKDRGMWHALADGERKVRGLLEDHVYIVDALLSAYTATGDAVHLRNAEEIMVFTLAHFWDKAGGFVDIATDLHDNVGLTLKEVRRRPVEDSPYAGRTR